MAPANEVFPTPGAPSRNNGRFSRMARKAPATSPGSARYPTRVSLPARSAGLSKYGNVTRQALHIPVVPSSAPVILGGERARSSGSRCCRRYRIRDARPWSRSWSPAPAGQIRRRRPVCDRAFARVAPHPGLPVGPLSRSVSASESAVCCLQSANRLSRRGQDTNDAATVRLCLIPAGSRHA